MSKKILRAVFSVAMAVLLSCLVCIMGILYSYFGSVQEEQLRSQLSLAAQGAAQSGRAYLDTLFDQSARFTWVAADGTVLLDTKADAEIMENHAGREEIREALEAGTGESSRRSATLTEETLYYAMRLEDGTVLRISESRYTVFTLIMSMLSPIAFIILGALAISMVLADRLSRRIVEPLESLDLEKPLENEAYDELAPMLRRLEQQHRQIRAQQQELEERRNEFLAVVGSMNEGLVLLSSKGSILSINPAAMSFFGSVSDPTGEDLLRLERDPEIGRLIASAMEKGADELQLSRGGREYRLSASRVEAEGSSSGVVVSIFDITEKFFAERNRREFTANVSHELKTPLQSIMGSAELMQNGLVKSEDMPVFLGRIRSEAARLVTLIEDIIHLSQLDEKAEMPVEECELYTLAAEELDALQLAADEQSVTLSLTGSPVTLYGSRQLIHEIMYNLFDNAVKYNRPGGSVTVTVFEDEGGAGFSVADTGIGIPPDARDRIFERFYRVDKSRSKKIGGTGLGLSIVKHAVQYMNGTVSVSSTPCEGTTLTVNIPKQHQSP